MAGNHTFAKFVSPAKCIERPWDLWASELGHGAPRPDDAFAAPAPAEPKGGASRRPSAHPYKGTRRYRRAGLHRLRTDSMPLHGLFPQQDALTAAVCHMCGRVVQVSAAYRHLAEAHAGCEPLAPPPPPVAAALRSRSRHRKEPAPPPKLSSPVHTAAAPLSRLARPQMQYLEPAPSTDVQVCVQSGELPVVSIQDTEELPLGENLTDDIFAIMNSEGIQSADDIADATDWKNIIRDIGNLQDINFSQTTDTVQSQDLFAPAIETPTYLTEDLSCGLRFPQPPPPPVPAVADPLPPIAPQALKPPPTPTTPKSNRSKTSKTKFNLREYDANKHCGVLTAEGKPCTRSLTCKAHALSLRRMVEGRAKSFDTLLAEHRASRDPGAAAAPVPLLDLPPLLVNNSIDLSAFNGLTTEQQVNDIYSLLGGDDPNSLLADPISSLLAAPLDGPFGLPEDPPPPPPQPAPAPVERLERPERTERTSSRTREEPAGAASDVCWYASCPRPLAICTFNASQAGGAITLGKKFATVRSNIKSSLTRSQCKSTGATNNFYHGQSALSLSKSVHMNASKTSKPEVRRLIVCSGVSPASGSAKEVHQTLSEMFASEPRGSHPGLNGHVSHAGLSLSGVPGLASHSALGAKARAPLKHSKHPAATHLDLGFSLDPLLADEKC